MKITSQLTDAAVLQELGERLERRRIDMGLTQAKLAEEAGISKRTVERIEAGHSTEFVLLLRAVRVLTLLDALEQWVPDQPQSPLVLLKGRGRVRKRVGYPRGQRDAQAVVNPKVPWKWRE